MKERIELKGRTDLKRIIAYARVSSREQAEGQHALEQQTDRLKSIGITELIQDVASGNDQQRPGLLKLIEEIKKGNVDQVVATRWDRLTRNESSYLLLKELLREYGVKLNLLDQGDVDFESAAGELNADMQAIFAIHERRMLKERVEKGFEFRRKKKAACGRQPWGYTMENEGYILDHKPIICLIAERPDNYQELCGEVPNLPLAIGISKAQIAREAIDYFLLHKKAREVLRYLYQKYGVERKNYVVKNTKDGEKKKTQTNLVITEELLFWTAGQNLTDWLQNPVLRGHTAYLKSEKKSPLKKRGSIKPVEQWQLHENTHHHQRLLSDEEFVVIQDILKQNQRNFGTPGSKFYLTGLIICEQCHSKAVMKRSSQHRYYGCRHSGIGCSNHNCIRLDQIERELINYFFICAKILKEASSNEVDAEVDDNLEQQDSEEVIKLKQQLKDIELLLLSRSSSNLLREKQELEQELESLQHPEADLTKATAEQILQDPYASHLGFWYCLSCSEREVIYAKLIKQITFTNGQITDIVLNLNLKLQNVLPTYHQACRSGK